jgi:hypothetical protein
MPYAICHLPYDQGGSPPTSERFFRRVGGDMLRDQAVPGDLQPECGCQAEPDCLHRLLCRLLYPVEPPVMHEREVSIPTRPAAQLFFALPRAVLEMPAMCESETTGRWRRRSPPESLIDRRTVLCRQTCSACISMRNQKTLFK